LFDIKISKSFHVCLSYSKPKCAVFETHCTVEHAVVSLAKHSPANVDKSKDASSETRSTFTVRYTTDHAFMHSV